MRADQETLFLRALLQDQHISINKFLSTTDMDDEDYIAAVSKSSSSETELDPTKVKLKFLRELMQIILFCQTFLRESRKSGLIESRVHVSIRDIMRAVKLYSFFSERSKLDGLETLLFDGEKLRFAYAQCLRIGRNPAHAFSRTLL